MHENVPPHPAPDLHGLTILDPAAGSGAFGASTAYHLAKRGLKVGCAPDTVLGTGIQTARKAVDDGRIGAPIAATAMPTSGASTRMRRSRLP